jgi:hypothetical protein
VPDQDIAALWLDHHAPAWVITGYGERHLRHVCILLQGRRPTALLHGKKPLPICRTSCHAAWRASRHLAQGWRWRWLAG